MVDVLSVLEGGQNPYKRVGVGMVYILRVVDQGLYNTSLKEFHVLMGRPSAFQETGGHLGLDCYKTT